MATMAEAKDILEQIGMPAAQQADVCCYTLLSMGALRADRPWARATRTWVRIHDMIQHSNSYLGADYKENSRETFRKQALHHFREAAIVIDNGKSTNSPNYAYTFTEEFLALIRAYGSAEWENRLERWRATHTSLKDLYASKKQMTMMPVNINGQQLQFSPGAHNMLQKAIIENFAPRFAPGCVCLYVGDTIKKDLIKDVDTLAELGFEITLHDKMPDVVLYCPEKNWLYFIEAVTSVGPMTPLRVRDIKRMTERVRAGKIFVTAFPNMAVFKRFAETVAWETEVWLAELPDHMIHLNGDRFMGPR